MANTHAAYEKIYYDKIHICTHTHSHAMAIIAFREQSKQPLGNFYFSAIHVFPSFILERSLGPCFIPISFMNRCINSTEIVSRRACMFHIDCIWVARFVFLLQSVCRSTNRKIILKLKCSVSLRFWFNDVNRKTHRCAYR